MMGYDAHSERRDCEPVSSSAMTPVANGTVATAYSTPAKQYCEQMRALDAATLEASRLTLHSKTRGLIKAAMGFFPCRHAYQPAQQESIVTSLPKLSAASFRPSTVVR
jgi:hypothetical protein